MNNESEQNRSMGKQRTVTERVHSFDNSYDVAVFSKQIFPSYVYWTVHHLDS